MSPNDHTGPAFAYRSRQRCDRGQPCSNCSKTSAEQCRYADSVVISGARQKLVEDHDEETSARIRKRLQLLESRIASIQEQSLSQHHGNILEARLAEVTVNVERSDADIGSHAAALSPRLSSRQQDPHFIPPSHWEGILDDVSWHEYFPLIYIV